MPHLESALLGVWIAADSRHELRRRTRPVASARTYGLQGHVVVQRRASIAEEIEVPAADLDAATSTEHIGHHAHALAPTMRRLAIDIPADIVTEQHLRRRRAGAREGRHPAGDRRGRGHARRSRLRSLQRLGLSRSADRPADSRHAGADRRLQPRLDRRSISTSHYSSGATVIGAAGAIEHERVCDEVERRFAGLPTGRRRPAPSPPRATSAANCALEARARTGPYRHRLRGPVLRRRGFLRAAGVRQRGRRRHVLAPLPGSARDARPRLRHPRLPLGLIPTPASSASMRRPAPRTSRNWCRSRSIASARRRRTLSEAEARRAKAQMKVSLLAALESPSPRCEQIARQVMAFGRVLSRAEIIAHDRRSRRSRIFAPPARARLRSAPTVAAIGPVGKAVGARIASRSALRAC